MRESPTKKSTVNPYLQDPGPLGFRPLPRFQLFNYIIKSLYKNR